LFVEEVHCTTYRIVRKGFKAAIVGMGNKAGGICGTNVLDEPHPHTRTAVEVCSQSKSDNTLGHTDGNDAT
jgi:hypothetical protein